MCPQDILAKTGSYKVNSVTPKLLLKIQNFEKKGNRSSEEYVLACFFHFVGLDKSQETIYKGPKGILTCFLQFSRSFFWNLKGR